MSRIIGILYEDLRTFMAMLFIRKGKVLDKIGGENKNTYFTVITFFSENRAVY
jgi:hypothetical protein